MRAAMMRRLKRPTLLMCACLALGAGVVLARHVALASILWLWLLVPLVLLSWRRHTLATLILLMLLCFGVGWWRGTAYMQKLAVHETVQYQKITVIGRAIDEAVYGKRSQLEFVVDGVRVISPNQTPLTGTLTVRGFGETAIYRGDIVQATGKLYPTLGNQFGSISFAELQVVQRDTGKIDELRRKFGAGLQSALPDPAASLAAGILIGQRTTLPVQTDEQLRRVGLTHIIAVSGYNLTIIVLACRRLLAKRSKFQATAACLALLAVFLLVTGFNPPVIRASIVSVLSIMVWYYGRTMHPFVLLLLSAAITLVMNPTYLWGNVSWYLSFLAFFGVLVLAPLITARLFGAREPKVLVGILIESICASVMVLPFILFIFGEMSVVGVLANLLVVPCIPLAMGLSLIAGLAGMWLPALAGWMAWPAKAVLTYVLDIASGLSRVPHAFIEHISFPLWALVVSYVFIGFVCLTLQHRPKAPGLREVDSPSVI